MEELKVKAATQRAAECNLDYDTARNRRRKRRRSSSSSGSSSTYFQSWFCSLLGNQPAGCTTTRDQDKKTREKTVPQRTLVQPVHTSTEGLVEECTNVKIWASNANRYLLILYIHIYISFLSFQLCTKTHHRYCLPAFHKHPTILHCINVT